LHPVWPELEHTVRPVTPLAKRLKYSVKSESGMFATPLLENSGKSRALSRHGEYALGYRKDKKLNKMLPPWHFFRRHDEEDEL
jgi:hypothetical protein